MPSGKVVTALPAETVPLAEGIDVQALHDQALASRTLPARLSDVAMHSVALARQRPLWLAGGAAVAGGGCLMLLLLVWLLAGKGRAPNPTSAVLTPTTFEYVKKNSRDETTLATLEANGRPTLQGKWHFIGPFEDARGAGFHAVYPPEQEIDLAKSYPGKDGKAVGWKEYLNFPIGPRLQSRTLFADAQNACVYFYYPIEVRTAQTLPVRFAGQEWLKVWLNGKQVLSLTFPQNQEPTAQLDLQPGVNRLLLKVGGRQGWTMGVQPQLSPDLEAAFGLRSLLDFLPGQVLEGETLKIVGKSQEFSAASQDMRAVAGSWWRASAQLQAQPTRVGDWLDLEFNIQGDRRFTVTACLTKAPSHGIIQLDLQGQPIGGRIDLYHPTHTVNTGPIELGTVALRRGPALLRVQVVGANERAVAPHYGWGLDCIGLR